MYTLPRVLSARGASAALISAKGAIGIGPPVRTRLTQGPSDHFLGVRVAPTSYRRTFATAVSSSKMAPITAWSRLVRYVSAKDGSIKYGEPIVSEEKPDIDALAQSGKLKVKVLEGANPIVAKPTGQEDEVKQLLGPLTPKDVPIVRCVGLNYRTHSM